MNGRRRRRGVVDIAINLPLPAVRQSLFLSRGEKLGAVLVDWRTRRPIPTKALEELYELPLQAIDWRVTLKLPSDLAPGLWLEPMQPAPGSPTGYVTLSAKVEPGWRADLPSVIVAPRRFWFGEAGELRGEVKTLPLMDLMTSHGWRQYQALKHGGENDRRLIEWQLRDLPRELREELLRGLRPRARAKPGNKRTHDHERIIAEFCNAIEHRSLRTEAALGEVAARHGVTAPWVRMSFNYAVKGSVPILATRVN